MLIVLIVVRITMILNNNVIMITIMIVHVIITITVVVRKVVMIIITMTILMINNGNRTEWSPLRSVIIREISKIGRPQSRSPICQSRVPDYRHNWTTQSPISIYHNRYNFRGQKTH